MIWLNCHINASAYCIGNLPYCLFFVWIQLLGKRVLFLGKKDKKKLLFLLQPLRMSIHHPTELLYIFVIKMHNCTPSLILTCTTSLKVSSCKVMSASRISSLSAANLDHTMSLTSKIKKVSREAATQRHTGINFKSNLSRVTMSASELATAISSGSWPSMFFRWWSAWCFNSRQTWNPKSKKRVF